MDTPVLISGAGPTGLMLACQLARRGIQPMIVDRHSGPAQQSRALAVQARTMEIYQHLGVAERALALGKIGTGANIWAEGTWKGRVPIGDIGKGRSRFPFVLILGQDDNERILGDRLREAGVEVQWSTELVAFEQHPDHVVATLKLPDGSSRAVTAGYLAGCDGAKSAVRELSKIPFAGAPYPHVFYVADTVATGPMRQGELNVYLYRDGFNLLFPMRGKDRWRIVGMLPDHLLHKESLRFEEVVPSIREQAPAIAFQDCFWFSTYRIHHRCADRFQDRRAFLLGDAAHIHCPAGGQGMNTGLQDAYNLGWKLALVLQGKAGDSLLATYAEERRPVAERLLETTDRLFIAAVSDGWIARLVRQRIASLVAACAMRFKPVQLAAFRIVSQTGITYRGRSLSAEAPELPSSAPQPGDRFPWLHLRFAPGGAMEDVFERFDDTRYNLLVAGQPASGDFGELATTHVPVDDAENEKALATIGVPRTAFYLLRPDGHVGLAGARLGTGAVRKYLEGCAIRL